ncbi:FecR family protein [Chitinophaga sp. CF118]|uniref:FecR family protein n=1 Tax=Chitinophaga sp. CF118 TaxID=1884367 RepID=UPI0008F0EAE3|nr:FecR family protein [Chitinophaga sp. CF118]SFE50077.1 FecR family protein [Chitinophaga sp. CF118]
MALNKEQLAALYKKYIDNRCTREELQELIDKLGADGDDLQEVMVFSLFDETWNRQEASPGKYPLPDLPPVSAASSQVVPLYSPSRKWWRLAAAAAVLCLVIGGVYLWQNRQQQHIGTMVQDIKPGSSKATLTLADGSVITLDSVQNGMLTQQGNTKVIKLDSGQLAYNTGKGQTELSYNVLTTPKGGQFQVTLPDGTQVWLNAASSLRYPTAFKGRARMVELSGEAYFEVAKNEAMPFRVVVNNMEVDVLGTHFNIMAYTDEPALKTTLLEGAVKVVKGTQSNVLKPGEQASILPAVENINIARVDVNEAIAWKEGRFRFGGDDVTVIMRQLARWYDVEVVYEGSFKDVHLGGEVPRNMNLSQVIKVLELSGIEAELRGRQLIITPE